MWYIKKWTIIEFISSVLCLKECHPVKTKVRVDSHASTLTWPPFKKHILHWSTPLSSHVTLVEPSELNMWSRSSADEASKMKSSWRLERIRKREFGLVNAMTDISFCKYQGIPPKPDSIEIYKILLNAKRLTRYGLTPDRRCSLNFGGDNSHHKSLG